MGRYATTASNWGSPSKCPPQVCRPIFPLRIAIAAPSLPLPDTQHLLRTIQHTLDDVNDFSAHHLRLVVPEQEPGASTNDETSLTVRLVPSENGQSPSSILQPYTSILDVYYAPNHIPSSSSTMSPLASYIANELQSIYAEEQASLAFLLSSTPWADQSRKVLSQERVDKLAKRKTRSFKYSPTYHLTISLFTPTAVPNDWDIEGALDNYLSPLLSTLSSMSNFSVDTQVQLFATTSTSIQGPHFNDRKQLWELRQADLSGFINAAEWPLSPSIGEGPTINFITYVPAEDQQPLLIEDNGANSWLIPQWGGVHILNLAQSTGTSVPRKLTKEHLEPAMQTFSHQLLSLLGLPETPASLPLRISTLTRVNTASLISSASSTLGALARLTQTLPSIAIPDSVLESVQSTISHLDQACSNLRDGRFQAALEAARVAEAEAEQAFFERSMVGQVYFPDEHKVAVYLPLLGPVAVPLLMAAIKELKALRKKSSDG